MCGTWVDFHQFMQMLAGPTAILWLTTSNASSIARAYVHLSDNECIAPPQHALHRSMHSCRRFLQTIVVKVRLYSCWSGNWYRRGVVIAGVTFGSLHFTGGRNWAFAAFASAVGVVYGAAFLATGNLVVPITAHVLSNIVAAALYKHFRQPLTRS